MDIHSINVKRYDFTMHLMQHLSYVKNQLSRLTYGRAPAKGNNHVVTQNRRILKRKFSSPVKKLEYRTRFKQTFLFQAAWTSLGFFNHPFFRCYNVFGLPAPPPFFAAPFLQKIVYYATCTYILYNISVNWLNHLQMEV